MMTGSKRPALTLTDGNKTMLDTFDTRDIVLARGLTLTESTGMLRDASRERELREAARRELDKRREDAAELEELREAARQRRTRALRRRLLLERVAVVVAFAAAVATFGILLGEALGQGSDDGIEGAHVGRR
ncbi:hypothetical protein PPSIR1_23071 [Plesiocystis pacifica SIR-1]|uniref:Uncharacterized protein n=2 Tax=Plesiocystis pacifica TaxID=191768 RepID=A6G2N7_9BACT|nr:hypothetical protein PPSIR1_23071 [Plesiocystis pacifica SIR-1]